MMVSRLALPLMLLLTSSGAAQAQAPLPRAFLGTWADSLADCEDERSDGRIDVSREGVTFFASGWNVSRWQRDGGTWVGTATVHEEGEEDVETGTIRLRLAENGHVLQVWISPDDELRYVKCPRDVPVR